MTVTEMPAVHETHFTLTLRADSDPACRLRLEESSPDVWMIADADELVADPRLPVLRFGEHAAPTVLHLEVDCIGPAAVIADDAEVRIGFDVGAGGLVPGDLTVPDGWTASPVADDGGAPSVSISRHGAPVVWPLQITISATLGGCQEGDRGSVDVALVGFHDDGSPGPDHFSGVPLYVYLSEAAPPNAGRPELRLSPQWVKDQDVVIASVSLDDGDMIRNRLAFTLQCPRSEGGDDVEDPYLPTITLSLPYSDSDNSLLLGAFCTVDALETSPPHLQVTSSSGERWVTKRIGLDQAETAAWTAQPRRPLCLEAGTTLTFIMDDLVCSPMPGEAEQFVSSPLHIEWASPVHRRTSTSLMVTAYPPIILENFTAFTKDSDWDAARNRRWVDLGWDVNRPDLVNRYELLANGNDEVRLVSPHQSATSTRMTARISLRPDESPLFTLRAVPHAGPGSRQPAPELFAPASHFTLEFEELGTAGSDASNVRVMYHWTPYPLPRGVANLRLRVRSKYPIVGVRAECAARPGLELTVSRGPGGGDNDLQWLGESTLEAVSPLGDIVGSICSRATWLPAGAAGDELLGSFAEHTYLLEGIGLSVETGKDTDRILLGDGRELVVHSSGGVSQVVYRWEPNPLPSPLTNVRLQIRGRDAARRPIVVFDDDVSERTEHTVDLDGTKVVELGQSSLAAFHTHEVDDSGEDTELEYALHHGKHWDTVLRQDPGSPPQVIKTLSELLRGKVLSYRPAGKEFTYHQQCEGAPAGGDHPDVDLVTLAGADGSPSRPPGFALRAFSVTYGDDMQPVFRGDARSITLDGMVLRVERAATLATREAARASHERSVREAREREQRALEQREMERRERERRDSGSEPDGDDPEQEPHEQEGGESARWSTSREDWQREDRRRRDWQREDREPFDPGDREPAWVYARSATRMSAPLPMEASDLLARASETGRLREDQVVDLSDRIGVDLEAGRVTHLWSVPFAEPLHAVDPGVEFSSSAVQNVTVCVQLLVADELEARMWVACEWEAYDGNEDGVRTAWLPMTVSDQTSWR